MIKSNVRIENPCHIKWQDLNQLENSKDRYCHECSLNIIDFTNMNNTEIIDCLAERKGKKVCCAMRHSEEESGLKTINRTVKDWQARIKSTTKNSHLKAFLLFSIGLLMLTTGCKKDDSDDDIYIGEPATPENSELVAKTTAKPNVNSFTKAPKHTKD
ncbi:hypothetical protein [Costertonia aggregata]|uniref:Uncharacterized protein n=1 Tax=Costertonia aggregata TaxID=343403 RepID=A0A7H9AR65_9FLAO|nr:hypothetical protein [Costertonia aggregata]QLG45897.1 hypothetical protein HYG79_11240 [Costertonia aggregata]